MALLARNADNLRKLADGLRSSAPDSVIETFPTDTSPANLSEAFTEIRNHASFRGLKLRAAIYSIKNASVKPFEEETFEQYMESMQGTSNRSPHSNQPQSDAGRSLRGRGHGLCARVGQAPV